MGVFSNFKFGWFNYGKTLFDNKRSNMFLLYCSKFPLKVDSETIKKECHEWIKKTEKLDNFSDRA